MAKLAANAPELHRYFSTRYRALISVRADGVVLYRTSFAGWRVLTRKKADAPLARWRESREKLYNGLVEWKRAVRTIPSQATLERWDADGICETPTGERVEPDGTGRDGVPSWLVVLGMI